MRLVRMSSKLCWTAVLISSFTLLCTVAGNEDLSPDIYFLHIKSDIKYRFATTLVTSKVVNPNNVSREVIFDVTLPNEAFMTDFTLEINNTIHVGEVKEKEEAKRQYEKARSRGQSAGYIGAKPRETNKFNIKVNVEAMKSVVFNLTYKEILRRKTGKYCHVIYIDPGQPVEDFQIEVAIKESRDITTLNVPPLRNDILTDVNIEVTESNDIAVVQRPTARSAYILYKPSIQEQTRSSETGIKGQFVVEYDVDRQKDAGDLLVVNGYFVHFFAPEGIDPLPKDVLFILDKSGSMSGRKIRQLKAAMSNILDDMQEEDRFNIMTFDGGISYWVQGEMIEASNENINNAKTFVNSIRADGSTNIDESMTEGIRLLTSTSSNERARVLIFLTDGQPTSGETNPETILKNVRKQNEVNIPVFSLAFGTGADYNFVKKMAAQNNGLGRKIYEDSDAALQITGFYDEISTVLLKNVRFTYLGQEVQQDTLTKTNFNTFFEGSEIMVAGRLADINANTLDVTVSGDSLNGLITLTLPNEIIPGNELNLFQDEDFEKITEKLWAYLTIKQKLKQKEASTNEREQETLKQQILEMSLKYNFVTPLTSMVVTLDEETEEQSLDEFKPIPIGRDRRPVQMSNVRGSTHSNIGPQVAYMQPQFTSLRMPALLDPHGFPGLPGLSAPLPVIPMMARRKIYRGGKNSRARTSKPTTTTPQPPTTRTATTTTTTLPSTQSSTIRPRRQGKAMPPSSFVIRIFGLNEPLCLHLNLQAGSRYKLLEDTQSGVLVYADVDLNEAASRRSRRRRRQKSRIQFDAVDVETTLPRHSMNFESDAYEIDGIEHAWTEDEFSVSDFHGNMTFPLVLHRSPATVLSDGELKLYADLSSKPRVDSGIFGEFALMKGKLLKKKNKKRKTIGKLKLVLKNNVYKGYAKLINDPLSGVASCWTLKKNVDILKVLNIPLQSYTYQGP